jgi:hypothetical protein
MLCVCRARGSYIQYCNYWQTPTMDLAALYLIAITCIHLFLSEPLVQPREFLLPTGLDGTELAGSCFSSYTCATGGGGGGGLRPNFM